MTTEKRIKICLLIEKMLEHSELSEMLGIRDVSTYCGKRIEDSKKVNKKKKEDSKRVYKKERG